MALINCPECGKDMSDSLNKCPHCGYKIKKEKKLVDKKKIKKLIIAIVILAAVLIGSVTWIQVTKLTDKEKIQVESINDEIVEKLAYSTTDKSVPELNGYIEEYHKVVDKYKQLNWKQKIRVNGYSKIEDKISHVEREEINIVVNAIDEIGSVTIESRIKIESAEENYLALSDKQKSDVSNHAKLISARKKYNELAVANTITLIEKIGAVQLNNEVQKRLDTAQEAYDSLDEESKSKITNYTTLTNKVAKYKKLEDNKDKLLNAKEEMEEGNLNSAKKILEKLPKNFSYNGTKVSNLLDKLNDNSQWIELCGRWTSTGGRMISKQISKSYGSSKWWYRDFEKGDEHIDVRCKLNNNGTVTVVTSGSIPIYTSYSVISSGVDQSTKSVSSSKKMTSYGTIKIDGNTSLTVSASGLSVSYNKVVTNDNVYFNYTYTTNMNLNKKIKSY